MGNGGPMVDGAMLGMSRAFVKEDAQPVPIQFRKATGSDEGSRLLTLSGAARLNAELEAAKTIPAPAGSPNAERLARIEDLLSRSEVVDVRALAGAQIRFGATVVLRDLEGEEQSEYQLVGEPEADLKLGRINLNSPLARALIGREAGESIQVRTPRGTREYEILGVRWEEKAP
jgi:transcription elongation factor GreA